MKGVLVWMVLLLSGNLFAEGGFPSKCNPLMIDDELVKISADKPSLVMIHNVSVLDLWITHPVSDETANAGWSSHLQAGHWSALALEKGSFELSCIESRPGHEQQVPCKGLLAACQWMPVIQPKAATGTFWAGEDMTLASLKAYVGSRGFQLPAKAQ